MDVTRAEERASEFRQSDLRMTFSDATDRRSYSAYPHPDPHPDPAWLDVRVNGAGMSGAGMSGVVPDIHSTVRRASADSVVAKGGSGGGGGGGKGGVGVGGGGGEGQRVVVKPAFDEVPGSADMTSDMGTPAWSAPELSSTTYTLKIDVYSFGIGQY